MECSGPPEAISGGPVSISAVVRSTESTYREGRHSPRTRSRPVPTMKDHYDPWYVRLPDGRTIKAKSTASVRHHVEGGHIPLNSLIRRDSNEEWVALVWVAEFADLGKFAGAIPHTLSASGSTAPPRSGVSARLDPLRLQTVGVRGLIDELIAALDSTLTRSKMIPAFVAAVVLFVVMYSAPALLHWFFDPPEWLQLVVAAAFAILVLSVLNALLAKLTHVELSTMRPARSREAMRRFGSYFIHVLIANVLVAGSGLGLIALFHKVPEWTGETLRDGQMGATAQGFIFIPILTLAYVLSALLWIIVGLCWLLTPAIVVEESSWIAGIREWRQLLRDHFGRIVVYEGLALMLGVAISLPLVLAISLALFGGPAAHPIWPSGSGEESTWYVAVLRSALYGVAAAPLLALLPVANVFIYLNLRYEQAPGR